MPSARACLIAQPGSASCWQSRKRHWPRKGRNSAKPNSISCGGQVLEAEFLQAGAVDQRAAGAGVIGQLVEAGVGGGVLAAVERCRQFARRRRGAGHQGVGQGRLAHAGLADQYRAFAGQQRQQRRGVELGREFDDAAAQRGEGCQQLSCGGQGGGKVALVEHDGGGEAFVFGGDQRARKQHVGEGWIGGDHQQQLRGVGGDQLLPVEVAAVEQAAALAVADDLAVGA